MYLGSGWLASHFHLTTINDFNAGSFFWVPTTGRRRGGQHGHREGQPALGGRGGPVFHRAPHTRGGELITHANFFCYNQRDLEATRSRSIRQPGRAGTRSRRQLPGSERPRGQSVTLAYSLYAGPKDFNRLDALGQDRQLMNYDGILPFSWLIVPMLSVLRFWHSIFNNYGVAIILLTLMIKAVTCRCKARPTTPARKCRRWRPCSRKSRPSTRRAGKVAEGDLRALSRVRGKSFGGCWPAFVQMPVFFQPLLHAGHAVELRGQSFLWVHDLTSPMSWPLFRFRSSASTAFTRCPSW